MDSFDRDFLRAEAKSLSLPRHLAEDEDICPDCGMYESTCDCRNEAGGER